MMYNLDMKKKEIAEKVKEKKKVSAYMVLLVISLLSLSLALYLTFASYGRYRHHQFPKARQTDVLLIQSWMTVPHIARVYGVPELVLFEELGEIQPNRKLSIHDIARKKQMTDEELLSQIRTSIMTYQKLHPLPSPISLPE